MIIPIYIYIYRFFLERLLLLFEFKCLYMSVIKRKKKMPLHESWEKNTKFQFQIVSSIHISTN